MFKDFEFYGGALGLKSCCLYGQTPYQQQKVQLQRGVDIVVATPGRIKVSLLSYDHLTFDSTNSFTSKSDML